MIDEMLADHFAYRRAMDSAWRWFTRNTAPSIPLSEIVARVQVKCPAADPQEIRCEIEERMARYRPRKTERRRDEVVDFPTPPKMTEKTKE